MRSSFRPRNPQKSTILIPPPAKLPPLIFCADLSTQKKIKFMYEPLHTKPHPNSPRDTKPKSQPCILHHPYLPCFQFSPRPKGYKPRFSFLYPSPFATSSIFNSLSHHRDTNPISTSCIPPTSPFITHHSAFIIPLSHFSCIISLFGAKPNQPMLLSGNAHARRSFVDALVSQ